MVSAKEAHCRAKPGIDVIGWRLDSDERQALLARFPPVIPKSSPIT